MTHTPAPWIVDDAFDTGGTYDICYKDGNNISVIAHTLHTGNGNHKANAQLICAAPELLEASIAALRYLCDENRAADDLLPVIEKLQEVIQKAEGK